MPFGEVVWALADVVLPAGAADRLGARRDPVRPGDAVGGGRRRRARQHRAGRRLPRAELQRCCRKSVYLTARATAMVCYLFIGSWTFSSVFAYLGGQEVIEQFVPCRSTCRRPVSCSSTQVIIFLLGWPLEWTEIIIIFVPIFLPLLDDFDIDPIFFGILVALNIADRVQYAAGGDGGVLSQGRGAAAGEAHRHLHRRAAVRVHGVRDHGARLHLPGHCAVAAGYLYAN